MRNIALFLAAGAVFGLFASDHPAEQIGFSFPANITVVPGRSAELRITADVPKNHHVYLKHANSQGHAILVDFSVPGETGFQLSERRRPRGTRVENEYVLRSKGMFVFELDELAMHESGTNVEVPLKIRVQICQEGEGGICYMPVTVEKTLKVAVAGLAIQTRDLPNGSLPWANSHAAALKAASARNQNVFALISDPSRCGACAYLENKVLSNSGVNKLLKEKFVTYRVPRNEYGHAPISGSFGIPFYFIISPKGENLKKWMGAPNAQAFLQRLEPYAVNSAPAVPVAPTIATDKIDLGPGQCAIPLKQSFAYQASQKGSFASVGNMRFVANGSSAGTYTVLTLDRTGEIVGSHSARLAGDKLVVEKYLGGQDMLFNCNKYGVTGSVATQGLEMNIELR
jgi:hypothetical protein